MNPQLPMRHEIKQPAVTLRVPDSPSRHQGTAEARCVSCLALPRLALPLGSTVALGAIGLGATSGAPSSQDVDD